MGVTILPNAEQLTIETGGQRLSGWLAVRVTRGVEMCPSNFECHITERFPGEFNETVVVPGSTCKVFLGNDLILSGWIDVYSPAYDAHTHSVTIAGRSYPEDIVDSTSPIVPAEYNNLQGSLKKAIEFVLKDFPEVKLNFTASDVNIPVILPITLGMTAYDIIELLCAYGQKLVWDDADGHLVVSDVGKEQAGSALIEGQNVEIAAARIDWSHRYNAIKIIGQTGVTTGSDGHKNYLSQPPHGIDDQIRKERLKLIIWDQQLTPDGPNKRADWESNRRKARSLQIQITVTGWRDGSDKLWTPNTLCSVKCPTLKVEANLLIAECSWIRGESGTQTIMTLMPWQGLTPQPFVPPVTTGGQTAP